MASLPLLRFGAPSFGTRGNLGRGPDREIITPSHQDQHARIAPTFKNLLQAFQRQGVVVRGSAAGVRPEQVLVLEIVGSIEGFAAAVERIGGMEWIGEYDSPPLAPAHGFAVDGDPGSPLGAKVFMTFASQDAMRQMVDFVDRFGDDPSSIPRPFRKWADIIGRIYGARMWGTADRLEETGVLEDWSERLGIDESFIPCEIELWYKHHQGEREVAERQVTDFVEAIGGTVEKTTVLGEIRYHGLLARLAFDTIQTAIAELDRFEQIDLFSCDGIRYFRPVGQCAISTPVGQTQVSVDDFPLSDCDTSLPPHVALLDGMPLQSHRLLRDRMLVDDPDGFESSYQVTQRGHGTGMASLICHGDIGDYAGSLNRPIYVRPIMKPKLRFDGDHSEFIPDDELPVDIIHRSIVRLFENNDFEGRIAPTVQIICICVCDTSRPFDNRMSPFARLLDFLAWKYNILFLVSAGNHLHQLELGIGRKQLGNLGPADLEEEVTKALADDGRNRRLLSPAETVNGLTIGAKHEDSSVATNPTLVDPFQRPGLPTVTSARGPGFRRAIKPELHLPGGRQYVTELFGTAHKKATLLMHQTNSAPGQLVAAPGQVGNVSNTTFTRGTSNAAAVCSRHAQLLRDVLTRSFSGSQGIPAEYFPVLIKAMLVHGSNWDESLDLFRSTLTGGQSVFDIKEQIAWLIGYGVADVSRAYGCAEERATVLGFGRIRDGESAMFEFPCPQSLSSSKANRRLTVTLAWFSPINVRRSEYRGMQLWYEVGGRERLMLERPFADYRSVRRGTVQHEVFEGDRLSVVNPGDTMGINVNCRSDAGQFSDSVRFGVLATLEVEPGIELPIYQEVREKLPVRIAV